MHQHYHYPFDESWSTEELTSVLSFFNRVEEAYEGGVDVHIFLASYKRFKEVVPGKAAEKTLGREFEKASGYSLYRASQAAKEQGNGKLRLSK